MAAARYWRLVGAETIGYQVDLELAEIALYDSASRVDGLASLSSTYSPVSGALSDLSDVNVATGPRFDGVAVAAPGFALRWDFGIGNAYDITEVRFGAKSDQIADRFIYAFMLQMSSDGIDWATVSAVAGCTSPGAGNYLTVPVGDPYIEYVTLLLHGEGSNGSTVFADSSRNPKAFAAGGNAQISTAQSKFGSSAIYFDGTGDYLVLAHTDELGFGASDFTIDGFVYPISLVSAPILFLHRPEPGFTFGIIFSIDASGYLKLQAGESGTSNGWEINLTASTQPIAVNQWTHVAVSRNGSSWKGYVNGVEVFSATASFTIFDIKGADSRAFPIYIGAIEGGGSNSLNGYLDDFRVTKGIGRYAAAFTPTSKAFTNWPAGLVTTVKPLSRAESLRVGYDTAGSSVVLVKTPGGLLADQEDFGAFRIVGTVKEKALPTNIPLRRRVRLHREIDGRLIRETWSDAVTGNYSFENIRGDARYTIISFDYTNNYRAVIADNVAPEIMP